MDAQRPKYVGVGIFVPREEIVYHNWKNDFFVEVLTPLLEAMTSTKAPPKYSRVLALDRSVRDFPIPSPLDERDTSGTTPRFLAMQRALVIMGREIALLQLHRRYFTYAMNNAEPFEMQHEYAPSVLATYLSASSLISAVDGLFKYQKELSVRFLHFWFNVFSAAVMLSLFISRAPTTPLATFALQDLERICNLFRRAADILPFSAKVLPHITKLAERGRLILRQNAPSSSLISAGNPYPVTPPPCFEEAHRILSERVKRLGLIAPVVRSRARGNGNGSGHSSTSSSTPTGQNPHSTSGTDEGLGLSLPESLPDIYHFSTVGVGVEERYSFTPLATTVLQQHRQQQQQPQNPFVPSSPRIAEDEKFNFDHGALTADLEETSYMAWF